MKKSMLHFSSIAVSLCTIATLFFSCSGDDREPARVPLTNKSIFTITNATKADTLYLENNDNYIISRFRIHHKTDGKTLCDINTKDHETELKDGNTIFGHVKYENGEIAQLTIDNWCELVKTTDRNNKKIYLINPIGNRSDLYMYLGVATESGISVTIN